MRPDPFQPISMQQRLFDRRLVGGFRLAGNGDGGGGGAIQRFGHVFLNWKGGERALRERSKEMLQAAPAWFKEMNAQCRIFWESYEDGESISGSLATPL
ncbi:Hypothetical predicted protein [Podarcis lilfordi]|uniref:Uncharacterized protein n=1 Tax=Podarcis lilfordi TaxID=74358 RepID=A0AA35KV92_9SAUR|nr:Hypothetical predicted protein [Podarcis lilfordi]